LRTCVRTYINTHINIHTHKYTHTYTQAAAAGGKIFKLAGGNFPMGNATFDEILGTADDWRFAPGFPPQLALPALQGSKVVVDAKNEKPKCGITLTKTVGATRRINNTMPIRNDSK
jgi:hypothetical protein